LEPLLKFRRRGRGGCVGATYGRCDARFAGCDARSGATRVPRVDLDAEASDNLAAMNKIFGEELPSGLVFHE